MFEVTGAGQLRTRLQIAARRGLTPFTGRQSADARAPNLRSVETRDLARERRTGGNKTYYNHLRLAPLRVKKAHSCSTACLAATKGWQM